MGLAVAVGQVGNPMLVSSHPMMVVATTTSIGVGILCCVKRCGLGVRRVTRNLLR